MIVGIVRIVIVGIVRIVIVRIVMIVKMRRAFWLALIANLSPAARQYRTHLVYFQHLFFIQ